MQPLKPLYKKMDKCIRLLEELNLQVRDIRRKNAAFEQAQAALSEEMAKAREIELAKLAAVSVPDKAVSEEIKAEAPQPKVSEAPKAENTAPQPPIKRGYNVDKYGRVYTEEEIQRLIAD